MTFTDRAQVRRSEPLACPPLSQILYDPVGAGSLNENRTHPFQTFGSELRVAFLLIGSNGSHTDADNDFWRRKCRELCLRPAVEPLLLAHWDKLRSFELTEPQIATFCSMLCGSKQQARTRDSYGLWDKGNVRFEPADKARVHAALARTTDYASPFVSLAPAFYLHATKVAHAIRKLSDNGDCGRSRLFSILS